MSQFLHSRKLVKYVNYENAELVLKLTKPQNNHNSAPYHRLARAKLVVPLLESRLLLPAVFLNGCDFISFSYFELNPVTVLSFNDENLDLYQETASYCILADLKTFFRFVNNICPSLFLRLNSCFNFILGSFKIYLSKITVSVIQCHVV